MGLNREQKKTVVSEVSQTMSVAQAAILAEYRGLTVAEVSAFRISARESGVAVRVVKNTLARRSVAGSQFECLTDHFVGPLVMMTAEDPVALAKVVTEFAKNHEVLKVKIGAMEGALIDDQTIKALARLPGREELLTMLVGTMQAPIGKFVRTLNEIPTQFVRALTAVRDSREAA
jgi:large subunit ribosomal protein L10